MSTRELRYITLAQLIGCVLVILGHSYPFVTDYPQQAKDVRTFLYVFHMPLFIFCSGFLFSYTRQSYRKSIGTFIKDRSLRILIPYFSLSILGIFPKYFFSSFLNDNLGMDGMSLLRAFFVPRENIWGHFWFLPMIFFLGVFSYCYDRYLFKKTNGGIKWGVMSILCIVMAVLYEPIKPLQWFGINDICQFAWAYSLGCLCNNIMVDVRQHLKISDNVLAFTGFVVITLIAILWFLFLASLPYRPEKVVKLFVATAMIAGILSLCMGIENHCNISRQTIWGQTYQIFILSWPCQLLAEVILERILHLDWWIIMPVVFVTGIIMPILLIKLIDWFERKTNTHFLSFIIGKKSVVYEK